MTTSVTSPRRPALLLSALLWAALVLVTGPARAHVNAVPGTATAGEQTVISFRIGHACDGSPTTEISVQLPDSVASVNPQFVPGWEIETTTGPLAEPVEVHGETVTEGIREITWSGGTPIPDHAYFDFGVSMLLPDRPGETLYFPVIQTCESGESSWIEIPEDGGDGHDLESPAPAVTLTAGDAPDGDHDAASEGGDAGQSEAAVASEPVATAELATSQDQPASAALLVVLAVVGVGLVTGLAGFVVARRRTP